MMGEKKMKLKKDIVIPAGTIFMNVAGESREYHDSNFSALTGLTQNSVGEIVYDFDYNEYKELSKWFEEID